MTQMALIWLTFHKLKAISGKLHASTVYLVLYQGMWLCFFVVGTQWQSFIRASKIAEQPCSPHVSCPSLLYNHGHCESQRCFNVSWAMASLNLTQASPSWPSTLSSNVLCRVILTLQRGSRHRNDSLGEKTELEAQFTSWFSSPSGEEREPRLRDGTTTLRRRFRLSIHSENNSKIGLPSSPNPSDRSGSPSPLSRLEQGNSEVGISLSDVGLQGALETIPSLRSNSIH
jgi:hypothetical protein